MKGHDKSQEDDTMSTPKIVRESEKPREYEPPEDVCTFVAGQDRPDARHVKHSGRRIDDVEPSDQGLVDAE